MPSLRNLDPKIIKLPDFYVRDPDGKKGYNEDKVKDYAKVARDSGDGKDGWKWPFPAIVVRKLKEPKGKKEYEVIDGVHRLAAAITLRMDTIPCEVREYATDGDAFLDQLMSNLTHGIGLDLDSRDRAIRFLYNPDGTLKVTQEKIARACHLSVASVSRICSQKQRTGETGARAKAHKGKKKGKRKSHETRRDGFSPLEWFTVSGNICKTFTDHGDLILAHVKEVSPETVADIVNGFISISQTFATGLLPDDFQSKYEREVAKSAADKAAGIPF